MSDVEYEVESVTKARVDKKRGKKIIWKYYVKWKGYESDESTWEPDNSFSGGSKHFIKTFWENALTRGRDHTNPAVFDKGEEVHVSGANLHLENNSSDPNTRESPSRKSGDAGSDDEPLTTKKRRIHQEPVGERKSKRKRQSEPAITGNISAPQKRTFGPKSKATPPKSKKQRRMSSPGPSKIDAKRRPSITNMTDTDAVGDLDTDLFGEEVKEVEDELMTTSPYDTQEIPESHVDPTKVDEKTVVFEDLQKYSPDLQNAIEVTQVVTEDETPPVDEGRSSPDPLFDSPSRLGNGRSLSPAEPAVPLHRTRAANPLVRLIDAPQMINNPGVPISAKARLMSRQPSGSSQDASGSNGIRKLRSRPGPDRFPAGFFGRNRSSLLVAGKGGLASLKGRFKRMKNAREEIEPIEDTPSLSHVERGFTITSWSDEDAAGETDHEHQEPAQMESASTHDPTPLSGLELLGIAGLQPDADMLPDFEDETNVEQPPEPVNAGSVVTVADGRTEDAPAATMTAENKAAEKSLSDATEHLFPSLQATNSALSITTSSWKTSNDDTIFGRMYKLQKPVQGSSNDNETVPTFKLILNVNASVPLVLKDIKNMKGISLTDISADKSMGSFYVSEDAVRIASTFSGLGSARVVLDSSADETQKAQFDIFQRRLQSGQIFVAKAGKELLTFFSSQNLEIAQRLAPPQVLVGLVNTVLLMRVQITNSNGYANAVMQISPAT